MANPVESFKGMPTWGKGAILIGGAGAAYLVYRHSKNASSSSSASSSGMVTDPSTGQQYPANSTDPVTGETYSQEIGQYGSVEAADQSVSQNEQANLYSEGDLYGTGYDASEYNTGSYGGTTTVAGSVYTSNSAWAQAATAGLEDIGYSGSQVAEALGLYLTSSPVNSDEATIIRAAIAEYNDPPVGSFQIILQPNKPATIKVPDVTGLDLTHAQQDVGYAGLKSTVSGPKYTSGTRVVSAQSPKAGASVASGSTVHLTYKIEGAEKKAPIPTKSVPKK